MTLYFLSGLGADKRVFQKLNFPSQYKIKHIEWVPPRKKESLKQYCYRLSASIDASEDFVLIGLSFGGMVATELSKIVKPVKTILISSASSQKEIPWYYKIARSFKLNLLIPGFILKSTNPFIYWLFGAKSDEDKNLLKSIFRDADTDFLKWAIHAIINWSNSERAEKTVHLHGTADRILPIRFVQYDRKIEGGHLMVFNRFKVVNSILLKELNSL